MKNTRKFLALTAIVVAAFAGTTASADTLSPQSSVVPAPAVQGLGLSRAEVLADTHLWVRAGLADYGLGELNEAHYDRDPVYAARLAEYRRLRSGPEYQAEVRRLGGQVSAQSAH